MELSPNTSLAVVLPVYNEAENLPALHQRLVHTLEGMGLSFALVFVDDGSQDNSFALLQELHHKDERVHVLKLSRNFGHHLALSAGIDHVGAAEAVVLMDADLQDQPEAIPALYEAMQEGYGVVYGLRQHKRFPWHKRFFSAAFRWVMRRLLGAPIEGGIFRILRQDVVAHLQQCREVDRIVIGLTAWVGFPQKGIPVPHAPRTGGVTSYTFGKQMQLAWHAITAHSTRPLKLASWVGSAFVGLGLVGLLSALLGQAHERWWLSALVLFVAGVQLLCTGILGAYIQRIFHETRKRPLYIVEAALSAKPADAPLDTPSPQPEPKSGESP